MSPKYLLDTNVWRNLAAGDLAHIEPDLLEAREQGTIFYVADLTLAEFLRVLPEDGNAYPRIRETLRWLDRLAGNAGLAEQWPLPLRIGLFETPPPVSEVKRDINQLRRRMLKATSVADLTDDDVKQLVHWSRRMDEELDSWAASVERMQYVVRGNVSVPDSEKRPDDEGQKLDDVVNQRLPEILLSANRQQAAQYPEKSPEQIRTALREFLHYHSGLLKKLNNRQPYNARKHRSDFVDCNLMAYCAAGYCLVTQDDGIGQTLKLGGCPDPRVLGLAEFKKNLTAGS